jgi:hypothetical protein
VGKPCQKIGAFDWGPTTDHGCGDAFVSEAKDYGTQVAVELALESARKLAEFPSASQVLYLCTRRRASRARLHEVARTAAIEVAAQLPEPSHDPWRPPSDSPATVSELGPAPPRKSRADQVSPLAQVSPILTEPLASLYNYGAWLHKRQRLLPAGP